MSYTIETALCLSGKWLLVGLVDISSLYSHGFYISKRLFIALHIAKNAWKSIRWEQNYSLPNNADQNQKLQKLNFLEAELPWLHRCENMCEICCQAWPMIISATFDFDPSPVQQCLSQSSLSRFLSGFQLNVDNWFLLLAVCQTCYRNNYF